MLKTVKIEKLVFGGDGISRTPDGVIFVSDVCAGETANVEITGKKANTFFARPVSITNPSSSRRISPCKYSGKCGGCNWLHIQYDEQLKSKQEVVRDCFTRIGKIPNLPSVELISGPERNCRIRTQLQLNRAPLSAGFCKKKSNEIIRIDSCMMLVESLDSLLINQDKILLETRVDAGQIKAIAGSDGSVASNPVIPGYSSFQTTITISNKTFLVNGDSFFQSNVFLLKTLSLWVAAAIKGDSVADLYGGLGFFSVLSAHLFKNGILVENDPALTTAARQNFVKNNIQNVKTVTSSAEDFLNSRDTRPGLFDTIIVDPPRHGLGPEVFAGLKKTMAPVIIYVSCNPSTIARDAGILTRECGYEIERAALFDMNPNTYHVETVMVFKKR
jgi:23S rRNA (uracil1939-C5)-methyltransferase